MLIKCLKILGARYKFKGLKKIKSDGPVIFISNHQSMWDIPPFFWNYRSMRPKFIAKEELARFIPSISFNLKHGGSVAIDRKKPSEAVERIKAFAKRVRNHKYSICIFPEGTRSKDGRVKPFKLSGIEAILKEIPNATFVPVAIKNTRLIDNSGRFFKRLGVQVTFTQLAPRTISINSIESDLEAIRQEIAANI